MSIRFKLFFRLVAVGVGLLAWYTTSAEEFGSSYMAIRPRFELNFPERLSLFRTRMDEREDGVGGAFEVAVFGGKTCNAADIARYLLPNFKDYVIIGEDASDAAMSRKRDVNAYNLGIVTYPFTQHEIDHDFTKLTFESVLNFCPEQKMMGLGLAYQHRFSNRFWADIAAPIIQVRNRLGLCETVLNSGGDQVPENYFGSALTALGDCNTKRLYGRMTTRTMKKTRLAFIDLRVGRDICSTDEYMIGGFVGGTIPTGNKPCARYLFEPIVGNSQHASIMFGSYGVFEFMRDSRDYTFTGLYNIVTRFIFPNNQLRSFDLRGKPWSRYMTVWKNDNAGDPLARADVYDHTDYLINYSTLCARVSPNVSLDMGVGFNYKRDNLNLEVGYNNYARKTEDLSFVAPFGADVGLPALIFYYSDGAGRRPKTWSESTIASPLFKLNNGTVDQVVNQAGLNDPAGTYIPITVDDLDPDSASQPACFAQMAYAALGYEWNKLRYPTIVNGGISYEFAHDNAFIQRWVVWLKVAVSI